MEQISYDVYYAVRNDEAGTFGLYDTPDKNIHMDDGTDVVRLEHNRKSSNISAKCLSKEQLGIEQMMNILVQGRNDDQPEINIPGSDPLFQNLKYTGKLCNPISQVIEKLNYPSITHTEIILSGYGKDPDGTLTRKEIKYDGEDGMAKLLGETLQKHSNKYVILSGVHVYDISTSKDEFHRNITDSKGTIYELVGYVLNIKNTHYTANVKRAGKWWSVTDTGPPYIKNTGTHTYNGVSFSEDGQWDPEKHTDGVMPDILIYKPTVYRWNLGFTNLKPSVIRNIGTSCYLTSMGVVLSNLPELVLSVLGRDTTKRILKSQHIQSSVKKRRRTHKRNRQGQNPGPGPASAKPPVVTTQTRRRQRG